MRRRRVLPLLIASGVHLALLASLAQVKPRPQRNVEVRAPAPTELEIDEPPRSPEKTPGPPRAEESEVLMRGPVAPRVAAVGHVETPTEPTPVEPPAAVPPAAPEPWTFSPTATPVDLGIGASADLARARRLASDRPIGVHSGAENAEPEIRPSSTTGGVGEAVAAADVSAGIGRAGAVLTAAEEAARADPVVAGEATFEVVMWRDGRSDVHLVGASGDADEWARVASALGSDVKGRKVRMAPGADGLRVTVHLVASWKLVDGRDLRSLHGPRLGLKPSVLEQGLAHDSKDEDTAPAGPPLPDHGGGGQMPTPAVGGELGSSQGPNPLGAVAQGIAQRVLPTPSLSVAGKVCTATLAVTPLGVGLGGGCSLENIGTHPSHIVAGQIVREEAVKRLDAKEAKDAGP